MRLAALGLHHETNTFAAGSTGYERFERSELVRGGEIEERHGASHATMAGFLAGREDPGVEVVPLLFANTNPSGTIRREAFQRIVGEMLDLLERQRPWDGVLLAQHGAMVVEGYPDADGELLTRVRHTVGPDVPIGVVLDLHANVSVQMVEAVDVTVAYRTNPHVDARERGLECARLVARAAAGEIRPVQALEMPPVVIDILRQATGEEPMRGLMADLDDVRRRPGMLSASLLEGYPYADVAEMGMSVVVVHDGDPAAAQDAARWLARRVWERREEFLGTAAPVEAALKTAAGAERGPVVLMDVGDNIGGGSPGDSTVLLEAARRLGVRGYLQTLCDPQSVQACVEAGVGAEVTLDVGGKSDDRHGRPVRVSGRVRLIGDGRYEEPAPVHGGHRFFDGGTTAVLETADGHTLVLTTNLVPNTSLQQYHSIGVFPERYQVVVAKGVNAPRAAYAPIAAEIILVDTPGVTAADLFQLPYRNRHRPLHPFEPDATYA
jgi:microcystin degradation protein MlrC